MTQPRGASFHKLLAWETRGESVEEEELWLASLEGRRASPI